MYSSRRQFRKTVKAKDLNGKHLKDQKMGAVMVLILDGSFRKKISDL